MPSVQEQIRVNQENDLFKNFKPAHMRPLGESDFLDPWNNFTSFFNLVVSTDREKPVWKRFVFLYPDFAQELTQKTAVAIQRMKITYNPEELPIVDLKKAYDIMAQLVSTHDPHANENYLIG